MDLTLTLSVQSAQIIIRALGRLPHDEVDPLLRDIIRQANSQLNAAPASPAAEAATQEPGPKPEGY